MATPTTAPMPPATQPAAPGTTGAAAQAPPPTTSTANAAQAPPQSVSSGRPAASDISPSLAQSLKDSLRHIVGHSPYEGSGADELAPSEVRADAVHSHGPAAKSWIAGFFPSAQTLDHLFAYEHMGNYVIERRTGRKFFESMPLYVRVGMHLLFVSGADYLGYREVERLLQDQSIEQGRKYDATGPTVLPLIQAFVRTYSLDLGELLVPDLNKYPTFNSFFCRRLVATARPITAPHDLGVITSPADCRLSVFPTVAAAKALWIKGRKFTLPNLLLGEDTADTRFNALLDGHEAAVAVCRLAPQDYHRFHAPCDGVVADIKDIKGDLYTVNPQAINEDLNVFTLNKRSCMLLHANLGPTLPAVPVAFVAVGAMLVGSIYWSKKPGDKVAKGEELGWFQYGGSTCIVAFPASAGVVFDKDLLETSERQMETLVQVGMDIASVGGQAQAGLGQAVGAEQPAGQAAGQANAAYTGQTALAGHGAPPVPTAQAGAAGELQAAQAAHAPQSGAGLQPNESAPLTQ